METEAVFASSEWLYAGGLLLVTIGISFLILEIFLPSFGLFGFAGVTSILIGVVQLHQTGYIESMPVSVEVLVGLAFLGVFLSIVGGYLTYRMYQKKQTTGVESMVGAQAHVVEWSDKKGRVQIQGETWQAYSENALALNAEDDVYIAKVDGLKLKIIPKN